MIAEGLKVQAFNGPIELLLQLIEDKKMQVNTISLAEITDDYLTTLKEVNYKNAEQATQFLLTASILVFIKSKSLLPLLSYTDKEEIDASLLEKRIAFLQNLKKISQNVILGKVGIIIPTRKEQMEVKFSPDEKYKKEYLEKYINNFIGTLPSFKPLHTKSIKETIKLEDMIEHIKERMEQIISLQFSMIAKKTNKKDLIVSFLALLELVRCGVCTADQDQRFSEIEIQKI